MKTILHLIPTFEGGGAERQLSMLATEQSRRGWSVHVGIRRGGVNEGLLRSSMVTVHSLGDHRGVNPILLVRIGALIKQIKPDVVQTWLPQMDIVGGTAALLNSAPWIVSERSNGFSIQEFKFQAWVHHRLVRYANAVVANSSNGAEYWRRVLPMDALVFQVANAVDVDVIRNMVTANNESINLSRCKMNILVVGRLIPRKGIDTVIKAVSLMPLTLSVRVLIIGEGPLRGEIEGSIKDAGIDERVSLLPYRQDWWGLLKSASALVSMSHFEGQPNVVLEAMAAGCPLIVSDIPEHREILNGNSAIFVSPNNPAALAAAMISFFSDPASARQRAERASVFVEGMTIQAAADAYELIYEKVIDGRSK